MILGRDDALAWIEATFVSLRVASGATLLALVLGTALMSRGAITGGQFLVYFPYSRLLFVPQHLEDLQFALCWFDHFRG